MYVNKVCTSVLFCAEVVQVLCSVLRLCKCCVLCCAVFCVVLCAVFCAAYCVLCLCVCKLCADCFVCVCAYICVQVYVCMCVCMCVCVCAYRCVWYSVEVRLNSIRYPPHGYLCGYRVRIIKAKKNSTLIKLK